MICIVYISSATLGLSESQIASIVKQSQKNNEKIGVTGILIYNSGNFMQLIEGKKAEVEALFEKISQDRRHSGVTLLLKEAITDKNFNHWLMGYRNLVTLKKIEQELLTPFLDEDLNFTHYVKIPHRSLQFLETFKRIMS